MGNLFAQLSDDSMQSRSLRFIQFRNDLAEREAVYRQMNELCNEASKAKIRTKVNNPREISLFHPLGVIA